MINIIKNIITLGFVSVITLISYAQDTACTSSLDIGTDLMSRYIWRGTDLGRSPSIQPYLSYTKGNFEIGTLGAFTTNGMNIQETDIYMIYTIKDMFSVIITDYFFPDDALDNNKYFEYNDTLTGHVFEASLGFNGTEKFPLSFLACFNFYGFDKDNSIYLELVYSGNCNSINYDLFLGLTPYNGIYTYNNRGVGVINLGITINKDIKISENYELPVSCSLITNPQAENIFLVFGLSF